MKVLLIGSGGREHSLALKISQSPQLTQLYIAPGNPGTAAIGQNIDLKVNDIDGLIQFAKSNQIDLTVVGPELPLALGIVDRFTAESLKIIGPSAQGAQLESSKSWSKMMMKKYHIPTADYQVFSDYDTAISYIRTKKFPFVLKADGLAQGKGVTVAQSFEEAESALKNCFINTIFADAGKTVVIEDFLIGEEASVLAFTDGKTIIPMIAAQDHKTIFDHDQGPNTGGMGAYAPAPIVTPDVSQKVYDQILKPLIAGLRKENIAYQGILYAGLMINNGIPSVVEFNVRFGDPETQAVLPLLETDILDIFKAIATQTLDKHPIQWKTGSAVCVVLASKGYPGAYPNGVPIQIDPALATASDIQIIHAGTQIKDGQLITNGGRVLGVVGMDQTLSTAIQKAYSAIPKITFETQYCRSDIGKKGLIKI